MFASAYLTIGGLAVIMAIVLLLPFSVKKVEEELELFLLVMGLAAVSIAKQWNWHLLVEIFTEPILISCAVLAIGFLFRQLRPKIESLVLLLVRKLGLPLAVFVIILTLGLSSSVITAIIAALVLAEVVSVLKLDRKHELRIVICACYAIGLGAALTPIGEPLSTIAVAKLKGPPHNAGFGYLFEILGKWIVPGIIFMALLAAKTVRHAAIGQKGLKIAAAETKRDIVLRAVKVYVFVMALVLLGTGLKPLAEISVAKLADWQLYWLNTLSAVLDNATLAAAEIVPSMPREKIVFILMGLLVAGGMLIPGNIPNIISASKLNIKSREWAKEALPLGFILMAVYFAFLYFLPRISTF